jgi:serine/threonine protein kinase
MTVTAACSRCRTPLDTGARFCQVCGLSVSGEQTAPLPTLLQLLRQATLGEYEILREIGQGGMATVYLAHEIALDRKVAIKVMSPQFVHGAEMIERFKREARTSASLTHPHIIPIYAVRESEQLLYFVMKYIAGRPLDAILRDVGPLPFPMVRSILADIGHALDYAHRQGVIHRDVKPGNIMIDEEGFAVITDFGIAKAAEGDALTRSGTTVGTPSYLSPEACSGEIVGPAADQYSLGIVGYEMVTGTLPFSADSSLGMMYAQVHTPPRPSEQLRPDCPADLRDAIMRMLEKSPGDRFPSMREAALAVSGGRTSGPESVGDEHVRSHIGLLATPRPSRPVTEVRKTPSSPTPFAPVPPGPKTLAKQRRKKLVRWGGAVVVVGAGVTAAVLATREPAPPQAPAADTTPAVIADPSADSLLLVARVRAEFIRQRALASGAPQSALAPGDSLLAEAESLAAVGRKAEAALRIASATALWSAAERPVVPAGGGRPQSPTGDSGRDTVVAVQPDTPAQTPSRPTQPVTPPVMSDSAAILAFYADLERAIESRQLGEVRRLLPNMEDIEAATWRGWFEDKDIETIQATYDVRAVTRRGDALYARVHEELFLIHKKGRIEEKRRGDINTVLTLGPQGWRQIRRERAR